MDKETCYHERSKVVDSRASTLSNVRTNRRRECLDCGERFSTVEIEAVRMKQVKDYELHLWINQRIKEARAHAGETDPNSTD